MAYGTPKSLDDVEAYYTDIRRGKPPPQDLLEELTERYRAIGGRSPLLDITLEQTRGLERHLGDVAAFLGQKHAAPFVADAVADMEHAGITRAVGLVLAPHYSAMSVGDYERRARVAAEDVGWAGELTMVDSWHLEPGYIDYLARRVEEAVEVVAEGDRSRTTVVFTAHSLPAGIVRDGDPYADQLEETARAVASETGIARWTIGWQSAGRTSDPWLGPDLLEVLQALAREGERAAIVCPCGFVSDHLEVLYDVDIEAKALADELGVHLIRTRSPNADPAFLETLAGVVRRALKA
jgi:ferrochelatase